MQYGIGVAQGDSEEMLKERYASGKISRKQYLKMKADLGGNEPKAPSNRPRKLSELPSPASTIKNSGHPWAIGIALFILIIVVFLWISSSLAPSTTPTATSHTTNQSNAVAPSIQTQILFNQSTVIPLTPLSQCQVVECGNSYLKEFAVPANSTGASITGSYSAPSNVAVAILTSAQFTKFNQVYISTSRRCNNLTKISSGQNDTCGNFVAVLTGLSGKYLPPAATFSLYYNGTPIPGYSNLIVRPTNSLNITYNKYLLRIYVNQTSSTPSAWAQVEMNVSTSQPPSTPSLTWLSNGVNTEYFTYSETTNIDVSLTVGIYYIVFYYPGSSTTDITMTNPIIDSYTSTLQAQSNGQSNDQQNNQNNQNNQNSQNNNQNNQENGQSNGGSSNNGGTSIGGLTPWGVNGTWSGTAVFADVGPPDCTYQSPVTLSLAQDGSDLDAQFNFTNIQIKTYTAAAAASASEGLMDCGLSYATGSPAIFQAQGTISSTRVDLLGTNVTPGWWWGNTTYTGGTTTDLMTLNGATAPIDGCASDCGYTVVIKLERDS
jgi:hypothetical protein